MIMTETGCESLPCSATKTGFHSCWLMPIQCPLVREYLIVSSPTPRSMFFRTDQGKKNIFLS